MREETIFDKILQGEIPAHKVYENEHVFAFLDIAPINKGHTLVIPKEHAQDIFSVESKDFAHVMDAVRMLAPKIKEAVNADGINIGINNGAAAGQEVFYLHIHIIPRFIDDGYKHWNHVSYAEGEAESVLEKIISKI